MKTQVEWALPHMPHLPHVKRKPPHMRVAVRTREQKGKHSIFLSILIISEASEANS